MHLDDSPVNCKLCPAWLEKRSLWD
jgi:hypothetical protein